MKNAFFIVPLLFSSYFSPVKEYCIQSIKETSRSLIEECKATSFEFFQTHSKKLGLGIRYVLSEKITEEEAIKTAKTIAKTLSKSIQKAQNLFGVQYNVIGLEDIRIEFEVGEGSRYTVPIGSITKLAIDKGEILVYSMSEYGKEIIKKRISL